ncbi:hypothetical protein AOQ84DRAFT_228079 [Glonium stellatum]|uniref:Uncharacterized protein n=1 Tax=Glonium stellatum TaxID=574774 RepID=A0A8E2JMP5_9PEZI|nr:hypothetical protein AOQ84DRAFT_228079 [Glonium stellatum]
MSPPSTPPSQVGPRPRTPLQSQSNMSGDMSMMFPVRPQLPKRFESLEQQQIKGLNFETIAAVYFPLPPWINSSEYAVLQPQTDADSANWGFFGLNFSLYKQTFTPSDWEDKWFFMYGRVHPYALTWGVQPDNDSETDSDAQDYTIPALIVRDQGYQPIAPRMFDMIDNFPITSPIVSFTDPIISSGLALLRDDPLSGLSETQRKRCGFVQLSTFITPGNSN